MKTAETQQAELITKLQSQIEALQQELQHKEVALRQAEAQKAEEARQLVATVFIIAIVLGLTFFQLYKKTDRYFLELCRSGDASIVKEAILNGANVNAKDNSGSTALRQAERNGHTEIANLLRRYGAEE